MIGGRAVYDVEEVIKAFRSIPHRAGDRDDEPTAGNAFDNAKKD
jgi:hypothetical protein